MIEGDELIMRISRIPILLILIMIPMFCIIGCNNATSNENQGSLANTEESKVPVADAIKIDQIPWETKGTIVDGKRRLGFTYTNNSEFCIVSLDLDFTVKPDATLEEIAPAFKNAGTDNRSLADGFKEVDDENFQYLKIEADCGIATYPGETSEEDLVAMGGYTYLTSESQLEYFQPNLLTIKYLIDNIIYEETYDCLMDSYSLSDKTEKVNEWPNNEFTKMLPEPSSLIVTSTKVEGNKFTVRTTGTSKAIWEDYIESCKGAGFDSNIEEKDYLNEFTASNKEMGYNIKIYLSSYDGEVTITLEPIKPSSKK